MTDIFLAVIIFLVAICLIVNILTDKSMSRTHKIDSASLIQFLKKGENL